MDKNKGNLLILIAAVLILSAAVYVLADSVGIFAKNTNTVSTDANTPNARTVIAPDFTLKDMNGESVSLSSFRGKYVIMNFWGSWCSFCVREMPDFQRAYDTFTQEGDTVILLVNATFTERSINDAEDFITNGGYTMPVVFDLDGAVAQMYNVRGYPTSFVIDKLGYVYGYQTGALTEQNLYDVIERMRKEDE